MKLTAMQFNGSENACQSLRILAELTRRGELTATSLHLSTGALQITISEPTCRERRMTAGRSKS